MGSWKFRKTGPPDVQEICVLCKTRPQRARRRKDGVRYGSLCRECERSIYYPYKPVKERKIRNAGEGLTYHRYIYDKEDRCSCCGFIPEDPCQLDIDHIDGDHSNNDLINLQTLCANCHRLKTKKEREKL